MGIMNRIFHRGDMAREKKDFDKTMKLTIIANEFSRGTEEQARAKEEGIHRDMLIDDHLMANMRELAAQFLKEENYFMFYNLLSIITRMSHVIRASCLDPIDANIMELDNEIALIKMKLWLPEEEYDVGWGNFMDACNLFMSTMLSDAVNGRKARILTQTSRAVEVTTSEFTKKAGMKA